MIGYILAILSGLSLGLLGGGGSILIVPILVYAFSLDPKIAVSLSLGIVGLTALIGVFGHYKNDNINFKIAFLFGGFALPGTFLGSYLSKFVTGEIQLVTFSIVMIAAAIFMFKEKKEQNEVSDKYNYPLIMVSGVGVGLMTGIIGVGGGFLIVPALILFTGTNMKQAVGSSLFIISFNSIFGFLSHITILTIPWGLLLKFSFFSIIGILIGTKLSVYVPQKALKKAFAVFLVIMGVFILYKNTHY